jgi:hypothetical protein
MGDRDRLLRSISLFAIAADDRMVDRSACGSGATTSASAGWRPHEVSQG